MGLFCRVGGCCSAAACASVPAALGMRLLICILDSFHRDDSRISISSCVFTIVGFFCLYAITEITFLLRSLSISFSFMVHPLLEFELININPFSMLRNWMSTQTKLEVTILTIEGGSKYVIALI